MALLLSLETATRRCTVALSDGARVIAYREEEAERLTHAERLNVFIEAALQEAGVGFSELAAVAVGIGPGSYTGLRIGLSAAKGLCYALQAPLIGMGTLDVLVQELLAGEHGLPDGALLMPMVDARRMEVFTQVTHADGTGVAGPHPLVLDEAWLGSLPADRTTVVFGDGADKASELWQGDARVLHVRDIRTAHRGLARAAEQLFARKAFGDLAYLVPDYGKPANVTGPRRTGS